ncbi:hypothetical protein EDB19DRAFT_1993852 [Suillus lakei]|nr:hypothetical protein EDB19DRAFT_1993852 [Suillus lakei]
MPDSASRKFIDLIFQTSSKWANWDPPIEIRVGHYGTINKNTGVLEVEGNIYEPAFQESLKQQGLMVNMSDPSFRPMKGAVEDDMIMSSIDVKKEELSLTQKVSALDLASASFKAQFQFQEGKRGAIWAWFWAVIHEANKLKNKDVVKSTFTCPGYCLYLSNKCALALCFIGGAGERVALALTASVPGAAAIGVTAGGGASVDWWTDAQAAFLRKAFDKAGQYCYTPLYDLKCRQHWLKRRWPDCPPPWDPLDEDGNEDTVYDENDEDSFSRRSAVEGYFPFV